MGLVAIKEGIYWVGVQDPDLRVFDIVMQTEYGTSYNSYLLTGYKKTVLIETVKEPFFEEFINNIRQVISLEKIDFLVLNHSEPDHSGSIARLLELCPDLTVVAHHTALAFLKEIVMAPFKSRAVNNRDTLDLGGASLHFINAMLLHWPDTIFTYLDREKLLFTCDSFGSHYSDPRLFNDLIGDGFLPAYRYYYDHILSPFKAYLNKALDRLKYYDIDMVCPGHGPILRRDIPRYVELYRLWSALSEPGQALPTVVIAYVSAYGYTGSLAREIARGLKEAGDFEPKVFDLVEEDLEQVQAAIDGAGGFLLGSSTVNKDALPLIWHLLADLSAVSHAGKLAAAFGSYGWSGEAVGNIQQRLHMLRMRVLPGLRVRFKPSSADFEDAFKLGLKFGQLLMNPDLDAVEEFCLARPFPTHGNLPPEVYTKRYEGQDLVVYWNPELCHHDTYCFTRLGSVFNPDARPWVNLQGEAPERIIRAINHCPSGALRYAIPRGSRLDPELFKGPGYIEE